MRACFGALSLLLAASTALAGSKPMNVRPVDVKAIDLPMGPYAAGFRAVMRVDGDRLESMPVDPLGKPRTASARKVPIGIWYPANPDGQAKPLAMFSDYVEELHGPGKAADIAGRWFVGRTPEALAAGLATPVKAASGAIAAEGSFPVLLYGASYNTSALENSDLFEFLASHGYVVVGVGSAGSQGLGMSPDSAGLEEQVRDLALALDVAREVKGADLNRVAAGGFSWGGLAAFVLAARHSNIKAVIGFDASVRYFYKLFREMPGCNPKLVDTPFVYFASRAMTMEDLTRWKFDVTSNFFEDFVSADRTLITFHNLLHTDYMAVEQRLSDVGEFLTASRDEVRASYRAVAEYALAFMDFTLNGKNDSKAKMTALLAALPSSATSVQARVAKSKGLDRAAFSALVAVRGFGKIQETYDVTKKKFPEFVLAGSDYDLWAWDALRVGAPAEAAQILELRLKNIPDEWQANYDLAIAYVQANQRAQGVKAVRTILTNSPGDDFAMKVLRRLGEKP